MMDRGMSHQGSMDSKGGVVKSGAGHISIDQCIHNIMNIMFDTYNLVLAVTTLFSRL